jgi:hypothetical protein
MAVGSFRDRDESADHRVLGAHDSEQAIDFRWVANELGADGDVTSAEPNVRGLPLDEVSFQRPPPGLSSDSPSRM